MDCGLSTNQPIEKEEYELKGCCKRIDAKATIYCLFSMAPMTFYGMNIPRTNSEWKTSQLMKVKAIESTSNLVI